ncbi:CPBP family intramembrane glutamic endopeptidase [Agromyces sp. M3QZ16-3]|uniref:CPBP family intramembrane glutamic endopeptidase n=1 Tax=Agromyces sp. M3QZ16-3 TaxID=3447585 RepID=UPI003F68FEF3
MSSKVRATWITAIVITVLFMLSQYVWGRVFDVDYETITDSTENLWTGAVFRVGMTALIFTVIAILLNRSWGGIYRQDVPRLPAWMWIIPIIMAGSAIARIASNDWSARGVDYLLVLGLGVLLVGVAEETTFRGIVVRALRGSTQNEFVVMLVSSVLFGVMHAVTILNGADVGDTMTQILVATIAGASFYITLRLVGNLVVPILLHALVDFSILGQVGDGGALNSTAAIAQLVMYVITGIAAVVILVSSIRNRKKADATVS